MTRVQRAYVAESLFPRGVAAFEMRGSASPLDLFPSERVCIEHAAPKRAEEFAAGRLCARAALAVLGVEPGPLLRDENRAPLWPAGFTGSITHTDRYCLAVAGSSNRFAALGVDTERMDMMDPAVLPLILRAEELSTLEEVAAGARPRIATVIFCAKEAFYKCQYALTRRWLGFDHVVVEVLEDAFGLVVIDKSHGICRYGSRWLGRFRIEQGVVIAAVAAMRSNERDLTS